MISLLGSFASVLGSIGYIILALLVLMIMIVIHELGHYLAGKIFKFKINEFSIGFGKALYTKKRKNGEIFSIRLIPLGGYCAFDGEDEDGESEDSFNKQAWWKRLIVLFSGAFFNFISAIIACVVLLAVVGAGFSRIETVDGANSAYLQKNDVITHVNGDKCSFLNGGFNGLIAEVEDGTTIISLTVERKNEDGKTEKLIIPITKKVFPKLDENNQPVVVEGVVQTEYRIGVTTAYQNYNFGKSLLKAVPLAFQMAGECLEILGKLVIGQYGLRDIGGPITTIGAIADASSQSLLNLILLFPLIAVNLAVFNLLPIPALDGARMVFVLIEAIRKKPVNRDLEGKIHTIGLLVLFGFVILVDILQLFVF